MRAHQFERKMKEFCQKNEKTLDKIKDVRYDTKVARLKRTRCLT